MKVRFKTEYQRSYRSRSASPLRAAAFAGLRSVHMGISREPCLQRRKKFNFNHPPRSGASPHTTLNESVSVAQTFKAPVAPPPAESEGPPGPPQPSGQPSETNMDSEKPETSEQCAMKSQQHSSDSPALVNPQESSTNHALHRKAGLKVTGQRSGLHKTEYNRQFTLKMAPAAPSPTLAAHQQALYSSHSTVPPFKKHPVSMETEYQRSFQGLAPPTSPRLRRNQEREQTALFHTHVRKNKNVTKNSPRLKRELPGPETRVHRQQSSPKESPPDPVLSHVKTHRVLTEYESRFRCPSRQIPEETEATTSHTSKIKELREQALSYRRRAWGTNFSRDHLSQLLSEHNELWEPTETTESTSGGPLSTRLDLCQVSSGGLSSGRSSCLEALDLPRSTHRDSAVDVKDEVINQTNKTNVTPQSTHSLVVEDVLQEQDNSDGEDEGRLPTPEVKMFPIQRTHLDLTTPATGGAILVGKMKCTDEVIQRPGTANSNAAHIKINPREAWAAAETTQHHKPAPKTATPRNTPPLPAALPPTLPLHCIQGTLRNANFQHNGELGLRVNERKCATASCGSDEDDRLSVMSWRSAASCSMASAVLERAQKRREHFWGKS
ncbi:nuclear protein MDM1 isoform X2 [Eucyclogobius newberryi]|uniref:nuclear protein MDM1 isoform X2 n=1 Tax=Eucyclogobius newberryi TaxID=166745 RepID=UPI003B5964DC